MSNVCYIFDFGIEKSSSVVFNLINAGIHGICKKANDTCRGSRQVFTSEREFRIVSQDKQTISDSDEHRENVSSCSEISERTECDFIARCSLKIGGKNNDSYIDSKYRK